MYCTSERKCIECVRSNLDIYKLTTIKNRPFIWETNKLETSEEAVVSVVIII